MAAHGLAYQLVQLRGGDAQEAHIGDIEGRFEQRLDVIAGFGRGEDDGRVGDKLQALGQRAAILFCRLDLFRLTRKATLAFGAALLLRQVPLIDDDDHALCLLLNNSGDVRILRCQPLTGINDQEDHVGALDGAGGAQHAVLLHAWANAPAPTDTGGIDQHDLAPLELKFGIDGVARRAWHLADNGTLATQDGVEQGRFAHVWPPDDGDTHHVFLFLLLARFLLRRQFLHDAVEQVASANALDGGKHNRLAQPQAIKFDGIHAPRLVICLVRGQNDGLLRAAQQVGHLLISGGNAGTRIDHEDDHVGLFNRQFRLRLDLVHDGAGLPVQANLTDGNLRPQFQPASVNQREVAPIPVGIAIQAVAGGSRHILYNSPSLANHPVKKRRFANIWSAYNSNKWFHNCLLHPLNKKGSTCSGACIHIIPSYSFTYYIILLKTGIDMP